MVRILDAGTADFGSRFNELLDARHEGSGDVTEAVRTIIAEVRQRGDDALVALSARFDRVDLASDGLAIREPEVDAAITRVERRTREALELTHERIRAHHERQLPVDLHHTDALGVELGQRWTAIEAAGLYVPGGTASYPSSVLMNAVPAKVAGVGRLAMVVPTPDGLVNPLVLLAARLAGVDEIYRIGGAQAVAALAYGTQSIAPVDKIVGPGNAYVAEAKRQVFGTVGIDMIAGPSEVLVIADGEADARILAADLLAQAEHDADAQAILMTDDRGLAERVVSEVEAQLATLPRAAIARASWERNGAVILLESLEQAPALADRIAPEHLELAVARPEALAARIRNAGAIFLGHATPEVIGDYVGGTNHVLPTARSARFSSGLGVLDFMKRTAILKLDAQSLAVLGPAAVTLARAEGLEGHARSVLHRLERGGGGR